jgi:hypothetical protein
MHLEKFYFYSFMRWGDRGCLGWDFCFFGLFTMEEVFWFHVDKEKTKHVIIVP